jgi:hypothetical protein
MRRINKAKFSLSVFLGLLIMLVFLPSCSFNPANSIEAEKTSSAISSEASNNEGYSFKTEIFRHNNTEIQYPQIVDMEDKEKQDQLNEKIKEHALRKQIEISTESDAESVINEDYLHITYDIVLHTDATISILFKKRGQ